MTVLGEMLLVLIAFFLAAILARDFLKGKQNENTTSNTNGNKRASSDKGE